MSSLLPLPAGPPDAVATTVPDATTAGVELEETVAPDTGRVGDAEGVEEAEALVLGDAAGVVDALVAEPSSAVISRLCKA